MPCPMSILKFVGTVSLGLLTGVSYTVSSVTLPTLLTLPSSSSASHALTTLSATLRLPILTLSAFSSTPLLLVFLLSPRSSRHPYLAYTSILAILSAAVPSLFLLPATTTTAAAKRSSPRQQQQKSSNNNNNLEASYEVLGDVPAEESEEDGGEDVNGEDVRVAVEGVARGYMVRAGLAAVGFAMAVVGIWGDGAPKAVVYVH